MGRPLYHYQQAPVPGELTTYSSKLTRLVQMQSPQFRGYYSPENSDWCWEESETAELTRKLALLIGLKKEPDQVRQALVPQSHPDSQVIG
jgi:hypothetical protein